MEITVITTSQMVRDKLVIHGPLTLGDIVKMLGCGDGCRANVLVMLNILQDRGEAKLNIETGLWKSDAKLY